MDTSKLKLGSITFNHAKEKGGGSMVRMDIIPANETEEGFIRLTFANQVKDQVFFDSENQIDFDLDLVGCAEFLRVLRGECEAINDGHGLVKDGSGTDTILRFGHVLYPESGFDLEAICTFAEDRLPERHVQVKFHFSNAEALAVCEVMSSSLRLIGFGI